MEDYLLGLYEKSMPDTLTLREKLEHTAQAGFDYLELSVDETEAKLARLDWAQPELHQLVDTMFETGITIKSICLSGHRKYPLGHPDAKIRDKSMEIMQKAIVLAGGLSARTIQIAGYDVYYAQGGEETRALFCENLQRAALIAAKYGVTLAFETMETEFLNTVAKAMEHVRRVNSPYLQIYPDIGNLTNASVLYGTDVLSDLRTGLGHISAMHLKETLPGIYREVPYGTGHVNFTAAIRMAMSMGVRMYVGEFWDTGSPCWEENLAAVNCFLRGKFKEAAQPRRQPA